MHLTDQQWLLIEPLLPGPSPFARGRPPFAPRLVMDGVLCKLRFAVPWYDLPDYYQTQPSAAGDQQLPSWQTCYRAYRRWGRQGLLDQAYRYLYQDLRDRGGLDLFQLLRDGELVFPSDPADAHSILLNRFEPTWQGATLQLLLQVAYLRLKAACRSPVPPSGIYSSGTP